MTDPASVLDALNAPAQAIKQLMAERDATAADLDAVRARSEKVARQAQALEAEVARLKAELARTGPVNPTDEVWLAQQGATLTFDLPDAGSRAGRPRVVLSSHRLNPIVGSSAEEVIDQARGRPSLPRGAQTRNRR